MKSVLFAAVFLVTATHAHASSLFCHTNVANDLRQATTRINITSVDQDRVQITEVTAGGLAHFVTAPRTFDAHLERRGPEMVQYTNAGENFELDVVFQPLMGKVRGTLILTVDGEKYSEAVVCE